MQHSLVSITCTDRFYIQHGIEYYLSILDRHHTNILKETDAEYAAWILRQYKYYMRLIIEDAYMLISQGSVDNHQKITNLIDSVYFMYAQAYEHTLSLPLKGIS